MVQRKLRMYSRPKRSRNVREQWHLLLFVYLLPSDQILGTLEKDTNAWIKAPEKNALPELILERAVLLFPVNSKFLKLL